MYTFLCFLTLAIAVIAPVFIIKGLHINGFFKRLITYVASAFVIFTIGASISSAFMTDGERAKQEVRENKSNVKYAAVEYLKSCLNDPDSYEEVEVLIEQKTDDHYEVCIKYRAKNAFGGLVLNTALVEVISNYKTKSYTAIGLYIK